MFEISNGFCSIRAFNGIKICLNYRLLAYEICLLHRGKWFAAFIIKATRVLMTFSLLFAVLSSIASLFGVYARKWYCFIALSSSLATQSIFLLISQSVYANALAELRGELTNQIKAGWSYYLGWTALLFSFTGAVYFTAVAIYLYRQTKFCRINSQTTSQQPFIRNGMSISQLKEEDNISTSDEDFDIQ